ncbi:MAG TPA: alpha/beta fold hydrolase [Verrucomicrobiales bacterium]|nr:alpha/beta fold hydrolase [Verrucomicrobiales bacterium]
MIWALHGAFQSGALWEPLRRCLPPGSLLETPCLWDMPGESLAGWARRFCLHVRQSDDRPILAGYSLGGRLALHALCDSPDLWKGGVVISAHPGFADARARSRRLRADGVWLEKFRTAPWPDFLDAWGNRPALRSSQAATAAVPRRFGRMARALDAWSLGRQEDLRPRLSNISFPVFWLVGEKDGKFVRLAEQAVQRLPLGRLRIVEGCGHRVPIERPDAIAQALEEAMESV